MGVCYSQRNKLSKKSYSGESYSNFDKIIFLQKFYMENIFTHEEISPFFTTIIYDEILKEKISKVKGGRFYKWFEMALNPYNNILSTLQKDTIVNSLNIEKNKIMKKQLENEENSSYSEIPNFTQDISVSEQGLRNYFLSNQIHFQSRVIKSPPASFRWISWIIMSGVPISRPAIYYTNLLTYDLPDKIEEQIQKDLVRTIKSDEPNYKEKINSLYRLLRALANLDKGLGYTQGMNFVVYYLLNISNRNEIDVFYLLMSIFSQTFSNKFGMRGFFIDDFPLLHSYTNIFNEKLEKFIPEVYKHIKKINLTPFSWISFWMQQIYTLVFPKETLLRIWDYFFVYGQNFLISLGLSIVEHFQDNIVQIKDIIDFQEFFKLLNPMNKVNMKSDKYGTVEYDIEKMLKNSIEKYYIDYKEIEDEIKKNFPKYYTEYAYDYKSIESNPDVKSEFAIYALNNSKAWSSKNKFSTSYDSTLRNSSKFKGSDNQNVDSKNKMNLNKKDKYKNNMDIIVQEDDSFSMDFIEEEIEDDDNFQLHIQDIISKKNTSKLINIK